jgi:hypothetical protein
LQHSPEYAVCLDYVMNDDVLIYRSEHYNVSGLIEPILPLAREGVQWVNEKVVIDHGKVTRSYYTYEFKGTNYRNHPVCYSYQGDGLNVETASLAAMFNVECGYDEPSKLVHKYHVYNNPAYETVLEEGRNLMFYFTPFNGWQPLYQFSETNSDIECSNTVNYHILYQCGDFLTRENFKEVEPLEIEGMKCRRYAYLGEDGEPLAYIVEGIGFDSRDMGDLLTPFTRQPDPDADYQEYCGLSHVIKDGKIIYKGMRYDADRVELNLYDVDGDGQVNIADVTALIDLLLNPDMQMKNHSDVDASGELNIADVTTLIDYLLCK